MNESKKLIQQITEGIQDKKGKNIVIADLSKIGDTICNYLVICQGNSPSQVTAIVESVKEFTRKGANSKPFADVYKRQNENWSMPECLKEMRQQAEQLDEIYYVYAVSYTHLPKGRVVKGILPKYRKEGMIELLNWRDKGDVYKRQEYATYCLCHRIIKHD